MKDASSKPPYEMTPQLVNLLAELCGVLGRISAFAGRPSLKLRRENRLKAIQSSLAIEGNTLSIEQVTAIAKGGRVLGVPREVQEVRNAFAAYERLDSWNLAGLADLLEAHSIMMKGLVDQPGLFRTGGVGIQRGSDIVHLAPPAKRVPALVGSLLKWLERTDEHPLIASAAFHYDFEFIHPFADGNGRIGRLWHTLALCRWNPVFAAIPIESIIHDRQKDCYAALRLADSRGDATCFIAFMLEALLSACDEIARGSLKSSQKSSQRKLLDAMRANSRISIAELSVRLGVSDRTVKVRIAKLKASGAIQRVGPDKGGFWRVI